MTTTKTTPSKHGNFQCIIGNALPELKTLELPGGEAATL